MRKSFGVKASVYPLSVYMIATYNDDGSENIMNAAWGTVADYDKMFICLDSHQTTENLLKRKALTISVGEAKYMKECDFLGLVSYKNDKDKIKKSGFTFTKSEFVDAPIINELSISLECELISYDKETGYTFVQIKNVNVDERVLDDEGKVDVSLVEPISYDPFNRKYIKFSEVVGNAFKDGLDLK